MKAEEERVGTKSINSWREHSQPPPHKTISNLVEMALQMRFPRQRDPPEATAVTEMSLPIGRNTKLVLLK